MILCKNCGYDGKYTGIICPNCKNRIVLDTATMNLLRREISEHLLKKGKREEVAERYRILADMGDTEAQREYGLLLEKGGAGVPRNIDLAMDFFHLAAKAGDALAAYRYSRLISRMNAEKSEFYLALSAFLGCKDAYLPAAEMYDGKACKHIASYYTYLAAKGGDVDAIIKMAFRYLYGDGVTESQEYAKWYMDKLSFPPLYAMKVFHKLRGVMAMKAPEIELENYKAHCEQLLAAAISLKCDSAAIILYGALADLGSCEALYDMAKLYLKGGEVKKNPDEAMRSLTRAAASGYAPAYTAIADMYLNGEGTARDVEVAIATYEEGAKLGDGTAYERLGDIYHEKGYTDRDVAKAYELYMKAVELGVETAVEKAAAIRIGREEYYNKAENAQVKEEAFFAYGVAAMMGHSGAMLKLAQCYAFANGTKKSRPDAFYWYRAAAQSGQAIAYFPLAICYSRGFGTAFNFDLAIENLALAHKTGDERAKKEMLRLYDNKKRHMAGKFYSTAMRLIYLKKFKVAREYLEVAARLGHAKATYTLGCLYEFGQGMTAPNKDEAFKLYNKSAKMGYADERTAYKSKILKMIKKTNKK